MPKYVFSSLSEQLPWGPTTVISGELRRELTALKDRTPGDVIVYGSLQLVRGLLDQDLVDELRLTIYPAVLGEGAPLFDGVPGIKRLRLTNTRILPDGIVCVSYVPAR
jgi:dihydrofolate reductase